MMEKAILFGPFVGEMYWEFARFAPILPFYKHVRYKDERIKFIILTREDRFDMYGCNADIFVPLRIEGDYNDKYPNCFRLENFTLEQYEQLATEFKNKYSNRYNILEHIYPKIDKKNFLDKTQFYRNWMLFEYKPRIENYNLVEKYLPKDDKPLIVISPRYRENFNRNWNGWEEFYDLIYNSKILMDRFNFILCGKPGEYIPDLQRRFYDINDIPLNNKASLIGLLLVIMERAFFTFGSQSAIPNISLLYGVEVLEFGCQKHLHTVIYNIKKTPIKFIENKNYNIDPKKIFKIFKETIVEKRRKVR